MTIDELLRAVVQTLKEQIPRRVAVPTVFFRHLGSLAEHLVALGKADQALELLHCQATMEELQGEDWTQADEPGEPVLRSTYPHQAWTLLRIGEIFYNMGEDGAAVDVFIDSENALANSRDVDVYQRTVAARVYTAHASALTRLRRREEATHCLSQAESALDVPTLRATSDHSYGACRPFWELQTIAQAYAELDRKEDEERLLQLAWKSEHEHHGDRHELVAHASYMLALHFRRRDCAEEARKWCERSLKSAELLYGSDSKRASRRQKFLEDLALSSAEL